MKNHEINPIITARLVDYFSQDMSGSEIDNVLIDHWQLEQALIKRSATCSKVIRFRTGEYGGVRTRLNPLKTTDGSYLVLVPKEIALNEDFEISMNWRLTNSENSSFVVADMNGNIISPWDTQSKWKSIVSRYTSPIDIYDAGHDDNVYIVSVAGSNRSKNNFWLDIQRLKAVANAFGEQIHLRLLLKPCIENPAEQEMYVPPNQTNYRESDMKKYLSGYEFLSGAVVEALSNKKNFTSMVKDLSKIR